MPLPVIEIQWRDNNGKSSETRIRGGEFPELAPARAFAELAISYLQPISSAIVTGYVVRFPTIITSPGAPALDSDVHRNLLLFYGNAITAATLRLPSPRVLSVDMVGPYRNVRLDLEASDVSDLLTPMGELLADTVTPGGTPWPMPLLAGGVTRYGGS